MQSAALCQHKGSGPDFLSPICPFTTDLDTHCVHRSSALFMVSLRLSELSTPFHLSVSSCRTASTFLKSVQSTPPPYQVLGEIKVTGGFAAVPGVGPPNCTLFRGQL